MECLLRRNLLVKDQPDEKAERIFRKEGIRFRFVCEVKLGWLVHWCSSVHPMLRACAG